MWGWFVSMALAAPLCPERLAGVVAAGTDPRINGPAVIVVEKGVRRLGLYREGVLATIGDQPACFAVALAPDAPTGTKIRQGDRRTPEGWYRTSDKPTSSFYHAIAVHYPNADDAKRGLEGGLIDPATARTITDALKAGVKPPQNTALGGEILIHGGGADHDWTLGCVALSDAQIDLLRSALPAGMRTDVLILP